MSRADRAMRVRDGSTSGVAVFLIAFLLLSYSLPIATNAASGKSTTVWSGTVLLPDGYTVGAQDVLVVQEGTTIRLGADEDITVDGRIIIEGTNSDPVILESIIGKHDGIVFNQSSQGLGSTIENLTITDAEFGITIYGSNPDLNDILVENVDRVAVDLFDGATPRINNLVINGGGQDIHGFSSSWRYGIGLSVGANSAPIVNGLYAEDLITRALNYWGNSGGLLSNLEISNISGATLAVGTGIWIEDSRPLITDVNIQRSDNGIFVRHITDGWVTRPTFQRVVIEDSMYRGVMVEQYNHSQFSNLPAHAIFDDLEIRGTGGPNAKTPGLAFSAFEVNTSGVIVDNALIEDNPVVGFKAYLIGSSTIINGLELDNNGKPWANTPINDRAGLFMRSVNWAPVINDLVVTNSSGPGILLWKGGAMGQDWWSSENGASGVDFREFHPQVAVLRSLDNGGHGVSVRDSSNVELSYVLTSGNGLGSGSPENGAGLYFDEANDVMSGGKNVSCFTCISNADQYGIVARDSIDLQLLAVEVHDPLTGPGLEIDNSGLSRDGMVIIDDMRVNLNRSGYAVELQDVNAEIHGLDLSGNNRGVFWRAGDMMSSYLTSSTIAGNGGSCFDIVDHSELLVNNLGLACSTGSKPSVESSFVNFTDSGFIPGSGHETTFHLESSSHVRWISSDSISDPTNTASDSILDIMWFIEVHAVNQLARHIPFAEVNLSFSSWESEDTANLPYRGFDTLGPYVGARWVPSQGWSADNTAYIGCDYDGVHNDSAPVPLNDDLLVYCRLELVNQPPFIIWTTPEDEEEFPSGSSIILNASGSWDLDDDPLTFTWTSSLDGDLHSSCFGTLPAGNNGSYLVTNNPPETPDGCLSDGEQQITLEVCDDENQCVSETRTIELFNRPPSLSVATSPEISSWGIMHLGRTANATISLEGSSDPENDLLTCWIETNYGFSTATDEGCGMIFDIDFPGAPTQFTLTIYLSDGNNPDVTWSFDVRLFNEIPESDFDVLRAGETSAHLVLLDGSMVTDPEGDEVRFEFWSDLDGLLASGITPEDEIEWQGWLTKGLHTITMYTSDDRSGHVNTWNSITAQVSVNNSAPVAVIAQPADQTLTDSGEMLHFDATGSGDWDLACIDLPDNGSGFVCSPTAAASNDLVSVVWTSDRMLDPIGSGWVIEARLPKGYHTVTLSIDDGSSEVDTTSIVVRVEESAPILVLDSPIPDIEVYSNASVLFDFRRSFDPDGDDFTVTVTSDLIPEPILDGKTVEYWYNDYLPAGEHQLTFELRDSTDRVRTHTQTLFVLETGPIAVIDGLLDGQYIPPGSTITLDGSQSYDYDNDIVLYQWTTGEGYTLGDRDIIAVEFTPGPIRIDLLVKDSRGVSSTASVNLTIGSSSPILSGMEISPLEIELEKSTQMTITVNLDDADGTTQVVRGVMKTGGTELILIFQDDGMRGDEVAGDGIWTYVGTWIIEEEGWVNVEVWAVDGEFTSPTLVETISVEEPQTTSLVKWLAGGGLPYLIAVLVIFILLGMAYQKQRNEVIRRDLEMIESWSTFDPRELDEEFDAD
ncbi:MAG: hypothetical protein VX653_03050 [Candidatus Thermoplasmatota archaeon]|nr:hypothetical protein [Candidatus Thermoplasmatota archaeon]